MPTMQVKKGDNGWPGIFIPGDNALGWATELEWIAHHLDDPEPDPSASKNMAIGMRRWATELRACYVSQNGSDKSDLSQTGQLIDGQLIYRRDV